MKLIKKGGEHRKPWVINKKAQEEIFGFVIIVLIVMIIGLAFFAFALRRPSEIVEPKQAELDDLLQAMLSYTTDCEIGAKAQNIRELARECYTNKKETCGNNKNVCDSLNEDLKNMLHQFLGEGIAEAYVHGYILNISNTEQVSYIIEGKITGNYFGSSVPIPTLTGKDIIVRLRFYYSKD